MKKAFLFLGALLLFSSCSENYSNGERIGLVTQFSHTGIQWKSWEGHLNMTQTGMNSSQPFDFSIDNDNENSQVISVLDSAATFGWKVKLRYHETFGKNWFGNRGDTDHFVTAVDILDKHPVESIFSKNTGKVDTIYIVVVNPEWVNQLPSGTILKK